MIIKTALVVVPPSVLSFLDQMPIIQYGDKSKKASIPLGKRCLPLLFFQIMYTDANVKIIIRLSKIIFLY